MNVLKVYRVLVYLIILTPWRVEGQAVDVGARCASIAGISASIEDAWAVVNNPAALARYRHLSLATSLEQRFLMKELGNYSLVGTLPVKNGCFALSVLFSGYQSFIDQKIFLGYGRLFGNKLLAGINLAYVYQKAGDQSFATCQVSYGLGTIVLVSDKVNLAFATFNPFSISYKSQPFASLPSVFKLGLSYYYSQSLVFHTELYKDLDYPIIYRIGAEYSINKIFMISCGVKGFPLSYSFGTAIAYNRLLLEFASSYHEYLGFTPVMTLQYDIR